VIENPDDALINVRLLPPGEYDRVVFAWNATDVDFPSDKCLHQLLPP
jgi:hypothetical protein